MEPLTVALLTLVAFLTSVLSAIVGMAGGIVLLSVMLLFLEPLIAIPLHAVVQLISNSSRTFVQRAHVDWSIVWRYGLPLLPTGIFGLWMYAAGALSIWAFKFWLPVEPCRPAMRPAL